MSRPSFRQEVNMGMNIVSDSRRAAARKHARRIYTCSCGKSVRGNGGWSSHRKACRKKKEPASECSASADPSTPGLLP